MSKYIFNEQRPVSWSSISSFQYDKEAWFRKYVLGIQELETIEMTFGKMFAKSVEERKPLAPVTIHEYTEYPLNAKLGGVPLVGYIDTYSPGKELVDHKTGKKPWTQKRADDLGQITMYLFMLFLIHGVKPEQVKCAVEYIPTCETGDFQIDFVRPIKVYRFETARTTRDILEFGSYIKKVYREMQDFVENHS